MSDTLTMFLVLLFSGFAILIGLHKVMWLFVETFAHHLRVGIEISKKDREKMISILEVLELVRNGAEIQVRVSYDYCLNENYSVFIGDHDIQNIEQFTRVITSQSTFLPNYFPSSSKTVTEQYAKACAEFFAKKLSLDINEKVIKTYRVVAEEIPLQLMELDHQIKHNT